MNRASARGGAPILLAVLLVGACTGGPPVASQTALPTATIAPPPSDAGPSVGSVPSSSPAGTAASTTEPPQASLSAEGGDAVVGQLGTFTWGDGGSDSPWLPGSPITVGHGEPLTVSMAGGVGLDSWSAARVAGGTTNGAAAVALGSGAATIAFAAPGSGTWSIHVTVQFAGDLGSASYYWLVTVR